ncbi:MAG: nickel responsive regulator [Methanobacterium sp. PtaB.Bin024]|jgi:CopG family nickel-responsive transcriptional regulator|nr:MAG: nickel responsive regulator [Methanobacterium sp. PtaB.Bin024]
MYRISSTLPKELINEFDRVLKKNGYTSRRKGLEDAITEYIRLHR